MSGIHILSIPYVLVRIGKMEHKNPWAKRSRCHRCKSLKPSARFHLCRWYPHPSSETGLYYSGHSEWICAECVKANRKAWFMPNRTFERLMRKTIDGLYPERKTDQLAPDGAERETDK